jgi:hypothetical protein
VKAGPTRVEIFIGRLYEAQIMARVHWIGGFCVVLVFGLGCGKAEFREFRCAGGRFTVQMPGTPKEQQQEVSGIMLKSYSVENWSGAYAVAYADIPHSFGELGSKMTAMLDGAENGMVKNVNAKLLRSSEIKLANKFVGREVKAELPNKGLVLARIFIINRRLYQVVVTGTREWVASADATKFLDSLTVE